MRKVGRIALLAAMIALYVVIFSGCFSFEEFDGFDENYDEDFSDIRESVSEGYFKLTIHTDKDEFAKGETIDCWAELEYIGDADSITVYFNDDIIAMDMTSEKAYYSTSESIFGEDTLILQKGKPIRCTLVEALPKSKSVLPGKYRIDAYTSLYLSPDGAVSYYGCVSAVILVKE